MPSQVQLRKRIFLACEGESERSYGRALHLHAELRSSQTGANRTHLAPFILGGGTPEDMLRRSIREKRRLTSIEKPFDAAFALFDTDRLHESIGVGGQVGLDQRAREEGITIIWQHEDHECFLLRHFEAFPDDALIANAEDRLQPHIPGYRKNTPANFLAPHLPLPVIQAFARREERLAQFLAALGLPLGD